LAKNGKKKGEKFLEKTVKFSNEGYILGYVPHQLSIQDNVLGYADDNDDNINNNIAIQMKNYRCENCDKNYTSRQHLWRHKQTTICGKIIDKISTNIDKLENKNEINELKKQVNEMSEIINKLVGTNNSVNTLCINNTNLTNNINNNTYVINYVNQSYPNAPALKMLRNDEIEELLTMQNSNYPVSDHIIFYYKKYRLEKFLGDIITNAYKKENPEEQQIWVNSVRYLSFIVRQIINKKPTWRNDKEGEKIIKNIINPILNEVKSLLQEFIMSVSDTKIIDSFEEYEKIQNNKLVAIEIITNINENILHLQILKYIAPHFQLREDMKINKIATLEKKPTKKKILEIKLD